MSRFIASKAGAEAGEYLRAPGRGDTQYDMLCAAAIERFKDS
jgi:hypothetical protein